MRTYVYEHLLTELSAEGVLTLIINRPDKLNALNHSTMTELENAFKEAIADERVRAVLLTGAGTKAFIAGADIREISQLTPEISLPFAYRGQSVCKLIEESPKPVVAAVNGYALGGGTEIALACHIRIASTNARFGLPEVSLGIIPGYGGTQRLTQIVGKGRAFELIMTGNHISAEEAFRIGLANHVVPQEELIAYCNTIINTILEKSLLAVSQAIVAINASQGNTSQGYEAEAKAFQNCCNSQDFYEGTNAFINKRNPNFS